MYPCGQSVGAVGRGVEDEFLKGAKMTQDFLQKMQQRYEELTGIPADEASEAHC